MKQYHSKVLLLNADYSPNKPISWQKAFTLLAKKVISVVEYYKLDGILDTKGNVYKIPAVVILNKYIKRINKEVPFSRKNIFIRDKGLCGYCLTKLDIQVATLDHIIPVSKWRKQNHGGRSPTSFENICLACVKCNRKKANKTPQEAGMTLHVKPCVPKHGEMISGIHNWDEIPEEWRIYLPKKIGKINEEK